MKTLRFGTAGIPYSTKPRNTLNGVAEVRRLGLDAMELEFVHSVNVSKEKAPEVQRIAKENDIIITSHGQYYINLAAKEKEKITASINRMLSAAKIIDMCGGWSITWHFAFYLGRPKEEVHEIVRKHTKTLLKKLHDVGIDKLWIRPEITGKPTQWGDLKECIALSQEFEQVLPCIDFAHLHARYNGINNSYDEWVGIMTEIEKELGRHALNNMHIQVAGINYSEKGEKNHLNLRESDLKWKELLKVWKEFKIKGVVIAETPNIEEDSLLLQKTWNKLR